MCYCMSAQEAISTTRRKNMGQAVAYKTKGTYRKTKIVPQKCAPPPTHTHHHHHHRHGSLDNLPVVRLRLLRACGGPQHPPPRVTFRRTMTHPRCQRTV